MCIVGCFFLVLFLRWCKESGHKYEGLDDSTQVSELLQMGGLKYAQKVRGETVNIVCLDLFMTCMSTGEGIVSTAGPAGTASRQRPWRRLWSEGPRAAARRPPHGRSHARPRRRHRSVGPPRRRRPDAPKARHGGPGAARARHDGPGAAPGRHGAAPDDAADAATPPSYAASRGRGGRSDDGRVCHHSEGRRRRRRRRRRKGWNEGRKRWCQGQAWIGVNLAQYVTMKFTPVLSPHSVRLQ